MWCFMFVDTAAIRHLVFFANFFQFRVGPDAVEFTAEIAW